MNLQWLLVTDVDNTLLGDDAALERFLNLTAGCDGFGYVLNSSRPVASVRSTLARLSLPVRPLAVIGAMGTEIEFASERDLSWPDHFSSWHRNPIDRLMIELKFEPHPSEFQTPYKASFTVENDGADRARRALNQLGMPHRIIQSGENDFDVIPPGAGKGPAARYCHARLGSERTTLIGAGDSGNDIELLREADLAIVVGNGDSELREAVDPTTTYLASAPYAGGLIEGLEYLGVFSSESPKPIPAQ